MALDRSGRAIYQMKNLVVAEVVKTFVYGDDRNTGMTETLDEFRYRQ
tara:strand:- start:185 stop:325 length:141 start_codon:yes stop_codon:yes gene_type:complete